MSYTVQQITALTETHISVLLSDDVAYDVDRGAFEEYVAPGGMYTYTVVQNSAIYTGDSPYETDTMSLEVYWEEFKVNDTPHIADLNDYISHSKSTQLDIDTARAYADCEAAINDQTCKSNEDILKLVRDYGFANFKKGTYQNQ